MTPDSRDRRRQAGDRTATLEDMLADPAACFASPDDVLRADLSNEDKRRVLQTWETDARRLEESAGENMSGGERSRLQAVREAARKIERPDSSEAGSKGTAQ